MPHFVFALSALSLPPFLIGVMILFLGIVALVRESLSRVSATFFLLTLSCAGWLIPFGFAYASTSDAEILGWIRIANFSIVFIPTLVFIFTSAVLGKLAKNKIYVVACFAVSLLFLMSLLWTDSFLTGLNSYSWGKYTRYGPLSLAYFIFLMTLMTVSLRLYQVEFQKTSSRTKKKILRTFLLGFSLGSIGAIDFFAAYGIPIFPCGYLFVFIFIVMMAHGLWRYRLFDITPSYAAETIIKTMGDALLVIDSEGVVQVANAAVHAIFSGESNGLVGRPISSIPIDFFKKESLSRQLWTGKIQHKEVDYINSQKKKLVLEITSSVIRDKKEKPLALVCIIKDVTQRKKAEEAMRESEKHYRLLAENATDFIWTMDVHNLKFTYVSPSVKSLRGFSVEETASQKLSEMLAPASYKIVEKIMAEELAARNIQTENKLKPLQLEFLCKDKPSIWAEVKISWLRDENNRPMEILGVTRDITDRMQAEQAVRMSEQFYSDMLQANPDPLVMLDRLGYVRSLNRAAELVLGYSAVELVGKHFAKSGVLAEESVAKALQEITCILLGWQRSPFEMRLQRKSGALMHMEATASLVRMDKDNPRVQLALRDINPAARELSA